MTRQGKALPAAVAALVAALAGSALAADSDLSRSRDRWQAAEIGDYRYAYQKYCECHREAPPQTFVTVQDGRVTRVFHLHEDSDREVPAREGSLDLYWTIDDLFDLIAAAEESGVQSRVRYDETLGYPVAVFVDYDAGMVGEELDLRLTTLEPLD